MPSSIASKQVRNPENIARQLASITLLTAYTGALTSMQVPGMGLYTYSASSTATVDGVTVVAATGKGAGRWLLDPTTQLTPQLFGAKGDGSTDDTAAFAALLKSNRAVLIPPVPTYYRVTNLTTIANADRLTIHARGAVILNSDLTKGSWLFQNCTNLTVIGGEWGYTTNPTANGGNSQHVFQFDQCTTVMADKLFVRNSPEMGIATTQSYDVTVQNSILQKTWRDGTYAHYSAKVRYINNRYSDCKDDAMSFHDYGRTSERTFLAAMGIGQSSDLIIDNCVVENCYQGFGSVAGADILISRCRFKNTVLAGVALMNQKLLYPDGTTRLKNATVENNIFENCCATTTINGVSYNNTGQASAGRASIICASLGDNNQIVLTEPKRQSNVRIRNNTILSSGAQGIGVYCTDNVKLSGNVVINCVVSGNTLGGAPVEVWECTDYLEEAKNAVIDTRSTVQHQYGANFSGLSGVRGTWEIRGYTTNKFLIGNSPNLRNGCVDDLTDNVAVSKVLLPNLLFWDAAASTDWNTFTPGVYQIGGAGWNTGATNSPRLLGAWFTGTLVVFDSLDTRTQLYIDKDGHMFSRTLIGLTGTYGAWCRQMYDGATPTPFFSATYDTSTWTPGTYVDIIPAGTMLAGITHAINLMHNQSGVDVIYQSFVAPGVATHGSSSSRTTNLTGNTGTYSGADKSFLLRYGIGVGTAKVMATPSTTGLSGTLTVTMAKLF